MKPHFPRRGNVRSGKILLVALLLMPVLLGILAMSVDIGVLADVQAKLRTVSDASALAGASALAEETRVRGSTPSNDLLDDIRARTRATASAPGNAVLDQAVVLLDASEASGPGDITVGYVDPANPRSGFTTGVSPALFNSVKVTASRDGSHSGMVPAYFGQVLGVTGLSAYSTSTAICQPRTILGFKTVNNRPSNILPIALELDAYNAMVSGDASQTTDDYAYNPTTRTITGMPGVATSVNSSGWSGGDGIRESVLYPVGRGYGNWGTLNIGILSNSTEALKQQILYGITASQMSIYPDSTIRTPLQLSGNPGISAAIKSSLIAIIGQTRAVPLYSGLPTGQGNNMSYTIVGFGAVRILDVRFQGSPKFLVVQPALMKDATAIAGTSQSWTQGGLVRVRLIQ